MALITCRECGKEISGKAAACPSCGLPAPGVSPGRKAIGLGVLLALVAVFLAFAWMDQRASDRMHQQEQVRLAEERAQLMQPRKVVDRTAKKIEEGTYVSYPFVLAFDSRVHVHVAANPMPVEVIVLPAHAVARFAKNPSGPYTHMPSLSGKQLWTMDRSDVLRQGEWVLVVVRPRETLLFPKSTAANVVVTATRIG